MDHASILRVLVEITGVSKAAAELTALDAAQKNVGGSASSMGRDLDATTTKARAMQADVAKATAVTGGLGDGLRKTGQDARAAGDGFEHAGGAVGSLESDLKRARSVASAFGDDVRRTGGEATAAGGKLDDVARGTRTMSSGFAQASGSVARAREELDRTGTVSRSTMSELNTLGSRGVQGLDRDLSKASGTIRKAERELADTGTISRRTARDLEALGTSGDGAGNGIRGLLASVGGAGNGISVLGAVAFAAVPVLVALAGATFALISALGPLVGLAGAAAVGLSAAGQAFGVFKLATMGVADALKEQTTQQSSAAGAAVSSASQQRAAARQIQSALDGVRSAHEQVRNATTQLASAQQQARTAQVGVTQARVDARRALVDMRSSLEDARLSEQQATFAVQDAIAALNQLRAGASQHDLVEGAQRATDALHNQQAAVLALTDAQDAYQRLVNGPDAQTIAEAQQAVTNAQHDQESAAIALTKAQQDYDAVMADAASTDLAKAEALARLHQAQDGVANSANRTIDAQAQLTKLQTPASDHEKAKALLAVQQAQDQVNDATNAATDAQSDLAKLRAPASDQEVAKALLAVNQAEQNLTKAQRDRARQQRDTSAAVRAGVAGSAQVVAAQRAVQQANQQVTAAQRALIDAHRSVARAEQQVHDAQLNAADSAATAATAAGKLSQKMDSLPAPAQAFVRQLIALKPKLDELRATAAAGLFPGVSAGLTAAMGSFGAVNTVVGQTAHAMGDVSQQAGELVGSAGFGKDIETIGGRNAKILRTLGDAAVHVVSGLRHVIVAAGPLTSWLARTADGWAQNFDQAAKAGRESGRMADFFKRTRDVLERLGSILSHTVGGLMGMGHAAKQSGNDMLKAIDRAAKRFDEWTHSIDGQKSLKQFFEDSRELLSNLMPVLTGVGKATASIGFGPMNTALKLAGPYAQELAYAFLAYKAAVTLAEVATKGMAAAEWLLNAAMAANPIVLVTLAIAALVAGVVIAYKKIGWFHDLVDNVFGWIKSHWPLLVSILAGPIGLAVLAIVKHGDDILKFFKGLPGKIVDAIKTGVNALKDAGKWVVDQIIGAIEGFASALGDAGSWVLDRIVDGFKKVTNLLSSIGGWVKDRFIDFIRAEITGWKDAGTWVLNRIVDGFKVVTDLLGTVGTWLFNKAQGFVHAEIDGWKNVGGWMLEKVVGGFKAVTDLLGTVGSWLKNRFIDFIHAEADGWGSIGTWVVNHVVDGFKTVTDKLGSVGSWLHDKLHDLLKDGKDAFVGLGSTVIDWVVSGLKSGLKAIGSFAKDILNVIGKIPGVGRIADEGKEAIDKVIGGLATGGQYGQGTGGGIVNKPIVMMGEEAPRHPEWVIPTNPAYRSRALMLHEQAGKALGLATGGVWGAISGAASDVGHAVSGAAGAVLHGPEAILKLLPGVDDLTPWLKDTGRYALKQVAEWVKGKVAGLVGLGGGDSGPMPKDAAGKVANMISFANRLESMHIPYGPQGHAGWPINILGEDCSSTVSKVLHSAGYLDAVQTTVTLPTVLKPGPGKYVTVHDRALPGDLGHTIIQIGGQFYGTSGQNVGGGPGWISASAGYLDQLPTKLHPLGLARGGLFGGLPYGGSFDKGGIVPGPLGAPTAIVAHGGETVTPAGGTTLESTIRALGDEIRGLKDSLEVRVYMGDEEITDRVEVVMDRRDRAAAQQFRAGVVR